MTKIISDGHDDVEESAVGSLSYTCGFCNQVLSKEHYSKKQMNRYEHKKITIIKCIHCIETIINKDSNNSSNSCYNNHDNVINITTTTAATPSTTSIAIVTSTASSTSTTNLTNNNNGISKSKDPSLTYINDPLDIPIIDQTQQFAKLLNCKYKIQKILNTTYWRTVVKLAVRGIVMFKAKSTITTNSKNNKNNNDNNNVNRDGNSHNSMINNSSTGINKNNKNDKRKMIKTTIGLFKPRTHQVISCLESIAHHDKINKALIFINQIRQDLGIEGYIEGSGINSLIITTNNTNTSTSTAHTTGRYDGNNVDDRDNYDDNYNCYLKYLILALERESNLVQLTIVWNTPPPSSVSSPSSTTTTTAACDSCNENYSSKHQNHKYTKQYHQHKSDILLTKFIKQLAHHHHQHHQHQQQQPPQQIFHSIWINYNYTSRYNNNIIERDNDSWKLVYGQSYVSEIIKTNMIIKPILYFPPNVFRQANICAFTKIIQKIRKFILKYNENKKIMVFKRKEKNNSLSKDKSSCSDKYKYRSVYNNDNDYDNDDHKKKKRKKMKVVYGDSKSHPHHHPDHHYHHHPDHHHHHPDHHNHPDHHQHHPSDHHRHHHIQCKASCIELYGGVGTIGLNCVDLLSSLLCSDENPNNKACFDRSYHQLIKDADDYNSNHNTNDNINDNHNYNDDPDDVHSSGNIVKNYDDNHDDKHDIDDDNNVNVDNNDVNFRTSSLSSLNQAYICPASYITSSASTMACSMNGLYGYDIVIVDPPRKGLDQEVIDALINYKYKGRKSKSSSSRNSSTNNYNHHDDNNNDEGTDDNDNGDDVINNDRLIYVSCGFESFKRDAMKLTGREPNISNTAIKISATSTTTTTTSKVTAPVTTITAAAAAIKNNDKKRQREEKTNNKDNDNDKDSIDYVIKKYWKLVHMEGHVLFPGSDHIETLAVFDREN